VQLEVRGRSPPWPWKTGHRQPERSPGQWLTAEGWLQAPYTANQGVCVGRAGEIAITPDATGALWVGGHARSPACTGQVLL
jgi:hypothetical protein